MQIITAVDNKYLDIVNASAIQNIKSGYNPYIYSIGKNLNLGEEFSLEEYNLHLINNLDINNNYNLKQYYKIDNGKLELVPIGRLAYKPFIIKKATDTFKNIKTIVWLDADAFIIKNIDEINNDDSFDIGITIRDVNNESQKSEYKILNGFTNAGVIFIKNNQKSKEFINHWIDEIPKTKFLSDQEAINRLILKYYSEDIFKNIGSIINIDNIKIKFFSTQNYNWYYYPNLPEKTTKIIHIKNNLRQNNILHEWFNKNWQD